jgi:signal transduction histidine kinase
VPGHAGGKHVPPVADGADDAWVSGIVLELPAQTAYADINTAVKGRGVVAVAGIHQLVATQHPVGARHHRLQQLELAAREPDRTAFDVVQRLSRCVQQLKRSTLRNIDVELVLLPASCIVAADEEKFQHVVEELVKNAATAMNHRGWIIITTNQLVLQENQMGRLPAGSYARLSVRDSGGGMSPDVMRRALDPLFSTRTGHQGWGLAKCAGFVRQCGGEITLSSIKGQGTAAEVYLPRKTV